MKECNDALLKRAEGFMAVAKMCIMIINKQKIQFDKFLSTKGLTFEKAKTFSEKEKRKLNEEFWKQYKDS